MAEAELQHVFHEAVQEPLPFIYRDYKRGWFYVCVSRHVRLSIYNGQGSLKPYGGLLQLTFFHIRAYLLYRKI